MCILCELKAINAPGDIRRQVSDLANAFLVSFEIISDKVASGSIALNDSDISRMAWCEDLINRSERSTHLGSAPDNVVPFKRP